MGDELVIHIKHGNVRELRMNRPPVNALAKEFLRELRAGIESAPQEGTTAIRERKKLMSAKLSAPLDLALKAVHAAIEGMSDDQMNWHPEGKWSTTEILEHLGLTYSRTAEHMEPLQTQRLPNVRRRNLKDWLGGLVVLKLGKLRNRKAPKRQVPKGMRPTEVRTYIQQTVSMLDRVIDECERRFGSGAKLLVHHALGPLSASDYRFHCVHTIHHTKQVRALRERMKMVGVA